jgi:DNA-directed RNA polymerase specialized sigma24 family protein
MVSAPATNDELESMYHASFLQLSDLAAELGVSQDEAPDLIQSVLLGSLHSPRKEPERWLTAALTAAAKQRVGER